MHIKFILKTSITLFFSSIFMSIFAQDLYYEKSNETTTTFGQIDLHEKSTSNLVENILTAIPTINKEDGWELVALDGFNYYYQVTDNNSVDYGQIDIWNSGTQSRSNYSHLSTIFTISNWEVGIVLTANHSDSTYWTLAGVDHGVLYFSSPQDNKGDREIVTWNGTTLSEFTSMSDAWTWPTDWRLAGVSNGIIYFDKAESSEVLRRTKTWNKVTDTNTDFDHITTYVNYSDGNLFGVNTTNIEFIAELNKVKNHIIGVSNGTGQLTVSELELIKNTIALNAVFFGNDISVIELGLEIVDLYDAEYEALFTTGNRTVGGYPVDSSNYIFEDLIRSIMQAVLDYSYAEDNIINYPQVFNNTLFETSSFFPGSVAQPSDPLQSFTVQINGTHLRQGGTEDNYVLLDARRPTGYYLAPGSIAEITVPASLVGIGASVLVGAHTWDSGNKPTVKRMDRVTKKYDINNETIKVANPLGGGVYINIPFQKDVGIVSIILKNVVRSIHYANTLATTSTATQWDADRNIPAGKTWTSLVPWADIETDKMMMQVPTSWIYATSFSHIDKTMDDWDLSMGAISDLLGRPHQRSKTTLYAQVDLQLKASVFAPGYPQSNDAYNPYKPSNGTSNNILIQSPRNDRSDYAAVFFHEMGHGERFYKFNGEFESYVNFLWVGILNKKFDVDIDTAFEEGFSGYGPALNLNKSAISWMLTENFRLGNPMGRINSGFQHEFKYQYRANGKYGDMVKLFGWHVIEDHHLSLSNSFDNGTLTNQGFINNYPTDYQMLSYSKTAGYDMRPLIHFWGIHPANFNDLETSIVDSGVKKSTAIYDQLMFYKTLVPLDNAAFRANGIADFGNLSWSTFNPNDNIGQSYRKEFYTRYWEDSDTGVFGYGAAEGEATVAEIQNIIDLYFPNGRPEKDNALCFEITPISVEASSGSSPEGTLDNNPETVWTTKGNGEYLIYDLGAVYDICDLEINFEGRFSRLDYFDLEVSRNNVTYMPVQQELSSTKTTNSYDTYAVSRTARYVKIIGRGNENDDWNSIRDVKFYNTEEAEGLSVEGNTLDKSNNISVFPVPSINVLNFKGITSLENIKVEIYDINGVQIKSSLINSGFSSVNISELLSGIYFVKINLSNNSLVKKFVIMK